MPVASEARARRLALPSTRTLALGFAAACFGVFCLLPALYMLFQSLLGPAGVIGLPNSGQLLSESRQRMLLSNSLLLGGGSAVLAAIIGTPLGILLARANVPAKRI